MTLIDELRSFTTMRFDSQTSCERLMAEPVCIRAAARIAELEAEHDLREAYQGADHVIALEDEVTNLLARIAALEAERDRLTALTEAQTIALRSVAEDKTAARIAELEAELAMSRAANGELIAERLRGESATRIAELEAEQEGKKSLT